MSILYSSTHIKQYLVDQNINTSSSLLFSFPLPLQLYPTNRPLRVRATASLLVYSAIADWYIATLLLPICHSAIHYFVFLVYCSASFKVFVVSFITFFKSILRLFLVRYVFLNNILDAGILVPASYKLQACSVDFLGLAYLCLDVEITKKYNYPCPTNLSWIVYYHIGIVSNDVYF